MENNINTEELYQKVHDLERMLILTKSMNSNMQHEIDTLQIQLNNNEKQFEEKKKKIEMELNTKWTDKINLIKQEIEEEKKISSNQILLLEKKISEFKNLKVPEADDNNENEKLLEELTKSHEKNIELFKQKEDLNLLLETVNIKNKNLDSKIKCLEEKIEETNHILDSKKDALLQTTEALKDIQEEKALLSSELAILKAGPIDDQRKGNSLFAEVHDNRQTLLKNLSTVKVKLNETQMKLRSKNAENVKLKNEKCQLLKKIQDLDRGMKPEQLKYIDNFKRRIDELELIVSKHEKQESQSQNLNMPDNEYLMVQWVYSSFEQNKTELRDCLEKFNKMSKQHTEELSEAHQEISKLSIELKTAKLDYEQNLEKMQMQLDEKSKSESSENQEASGEINTGNCGPKEGIKSVKFAD